MSKSRDRRKNKVQRGLFVSSTAFLLLELLLSGDCCLGFGALSLAQPQLRSSSSVFLASCNGFLGGSRECRSFRSATTLRMSIEADGDRQNNKYLRWKQPGDDNSDSWEMQTAVTTFRRTNPRNKAVETVELHAQLHVGDASYFDYYNSATFQTDKDAILFELLVDQDLLEQDAQTGVLRLSKSAPPLRASMADEVLTQQYGWSSQVNVMTYSNLGGKNKWIHADLTRQDFLQRLKEQKGAEQKCGDTKTPLWQLATDTPTFPLAWEAATALLVGPPAVSSSSSSAAASSDLSMLQRRLFSNLFLSGSSLANVLRAALWATVPLPELSVLLLDGASLLLVDGSKSRKQQTTTMMTWSPISLTILQCLMSFQWRGMQQLLFGQQQILLMQATQAVGTSSKRKNEDDVLIEQRNQRALQVLRQTLDQGGGNQRAALLYGCQHCLGLHQQLVSEEGFTPVSTTWRTAWSVPTTTTTTTSDTNYNNLLLLSPLVISYFAAGGYDWLETWKDIATSTTGFQVALDFGLYLIRHVMLYVVLSKFVLEWRDNSNSLD